MTARQKIASSHSEIYPADIVGVRFDLLSSKEIQERGVVEVAKSETVENGSEVPNGLYDKRLGPLQEGDICQTCKCGIDLCPGHEGYCTLAKPIFNIEYLNIIKQILQCICISCGSSLCDLEQLTRFTKVKKNKRLQTIFHSLGSKRYCKNPECKCRRLQPTITKDSLKIFIQYKDDADSEKNKQELPAEYVLTLFNKLDYEFVKLLGFNYNSHPKNMILQNIVIPPPSVRPSVKMDSSQRAEDDTTIGLLTLIKWNSLMKQKLDKTPELDIFNATPEQIQKHYERTANLVLPLTFYTATITNNNLPKIPAAQHRNGKQIKDIKSRLRGKNGTVRQFLMGKRVDFSARSVITGDPMLDVDEFGVPIPVAMSQTFPELVTASNKEFLQKLVNNGPNEYPGAKRIFKRNKNVYDLRYASEDLKILEYGDEVERHLLDGDMILVNRQPTLHKMSMMGLRVKVMRKNTFRLNVLITPPFNADFDGDEMNIFTPQSYQARTELRYLAAAKWQQISPASCQSNIHPIQDAGVGIFRITSENTQMRRKLFNKLATWDKSYKIITKLLNNPDNEIMSGREIISMLLPKLNLSKATNSKNLDSAPESDKLLKIVDGEILSGALDKSCFKSKATGILTTIHHQYGPDAVFNLLNSLQRIINEWLSWSGFSIGMKDIMPSKVTRDKVNEILEQKCIEVDEKLKEITEGKMDIQLGNTPRKQFEDTVHAILNRARDESGKIAMENLDYNNALLQMSTAGSKGSIINIGQIQSCVGPQKIEEKRAPKNYGGRSLPCYTKGEDRAVARGFVNSSFYTGLTPQHFFAHAAAGREGLIDTAIKTSTVGYFSRRLIKAEENYVLWADGSVRSTSGSVVQLVYGSDGIDGSKIELQKLPSIMLNNQEMKNKYKWTTAELDSIYGKQRFKVEEIDIEFEKLMEERDKLREIMSTFGEMNDNYHGPTNIKRIIGNIKIDENDNSGIPTPLEVYELVNDTVSEGLIDIMGSNCDEVRRSLYESATEIVRILFRSSLSSKLIIKDKRFTRNALNECLKRVLKGYRNSLACHGEMVGVIAASSISEPTTQMTLNTFHYAGVDSKSNLTRGVPRMTELLNHHKNIKQPSVTIYLNPEEAHSKEAARRLQRRIEHIYLDQVTEMTEIIFEPDIRTTLVEADKRMVNDTLKYSLYDDMPDDLMSWVIRFTLDLDKLFLKQTSEKMISQSIMRSDPNLYCICSDIGASKHVIRVYIRKTKFSVEPKNICMSLSKIAATLKHDLAIKGIPGVVNVEIRSQPVTVFDKDGSPKTETHYYLDTDGTNLGKILSCPGVDVSRTRSNDISEILTELGIEAAKKVIEEEMIAVVQFDGTWVLPKHFSMITDYMTWKGTILSVDRHGMNKSNEGPLTKSSFEETASKFLDAAAFGETDDMQGVSARIMFNKKFRGGTGMGNVIIDDSYGCVNINNLHKSII